MDKMDGKRAVQLWTVLKENWPDTGIDEDFTFQIFYNK
jgi:hypothetical protein